MTPPTALIIENELPVGPDRSRGDRLGMIAAVMQLAGPFALSHHPAQPVGAQHTELEREPVDLALTDRPESALKLRALALPYTNAPRTWAMGIGQEGFIPQRPAPPIAEALNAGAVAAPVGFWNNIPLEEQREPVPVLPPSYGRKKLDMAAVNVKEMAILLGLTYLFLVLSHMVILIMRYTH